MSANRSSLITQLTTNLTNSNVSVSAELPFESGGDTLYDKNMKTLYVDEEQISQDSFINDSTQLGYTQDELDLAEIALTPKERADILLHRQLDNEVEKSKIFATPILNIGRCVYRPAAVEEVLGA